MEANEAKFVEILTEALELWKEKQREEGNIARIRVQNFEEAVILADNQGLVVDLNREQFQITVVQSR